MAEERILVVEDNPLNMELVCDILDARGYIVDAAVNGSQAMEMIKRNRPDLILMDIQLPGIDGLTIARMLKSDPSTLDIAIIAVTAHAMRGDEVKVYEAGCSGYLAKPIDTRELPRVVERFLPKRSGQEQTAV